MLQIITNLVHRLVLKQPVQETHPVFIVYLDIEIQWIGVWFFSLILNQWNKAWMMPFAVCLNWNNIIQKAFIWF